MDETHNLPDPGLRANAATCAFADCVVESVYIERAAIKTVCSV